MCLRDFTVLDYPVQAWELIVVNDGGTKSFTAIGSNLKQRLPLKLVDIDHAGPATARNAGAKIACGDYLAFTDDDCRVEPDWLRRFAEGFSDGDWDVLSGRTLNPFPKNCAAAAYQYLIDFLYDYMRDEAGNTLLLTSNNVACCRSVYDALGGFDETFPWAAAEDLELSYRLLASGYRKCYYPDAKVWHHHRLTWRGYISQQFRYGRGGYLLQQVQENSKPYQNIRPYPKRSFYGPLGKSLWHAKAPPWMWLLQSMSQMAYHAGKGYQTLRGRPSFR